MSKFRTVVIDTINQAQNDLYIKLLKDKKRGATFDDWRDFGVEILDLYAFIKSLPNTIPIQILGYEATGKTVGGRFLNPEETAWLNVDKKPLTFVGGRKMYSREKKNYDEPSSYADIEKALTEIHKASKKPLVVFILGHIEDYKNKDNEMRQRLKILGKMANKHNIEGALSHCYYTHVDDTLKLTDPMRYQLRTIANKDTARSPMGMWESEVIPNNLQLIVDKVVADFEGEL